MYATLPSHMESKNMHMKGNNKLCYCFLLCVFLQALRLASAEVHYHEFVVQETVVERLCKSRKIVTVNGQFPGPKLEVNNGDSLVIKVVNHAKHNVTIHWHGVRQMRNGWADGAAYVTQCPIQYGASYTYRFKIEDQEGTLWWHAHARLLRATVYGAIVIHPKKYAVYPFLKPDREALVIFGEWWIQDSFETFERVSNVGNPANASDALIINGQPGELFPCSNKDTTVISVTSGQTVLLRFINAAMEADLFVAVAGHTMTVVAVDACYTKPFTTSYLEIGPGQTTDVLIQASQPHGRYYIAARTYDSGYPLVPFDNSTATAILEYSLEGCDECPGVMNPPYLQPLFPALPKYEDREAADAFGDGLRSPSAVNIPKPVDEQLFITVSLGLTGGRVTSSMNNISFVLPTTQSMLQALHVYQSGVFTADFPALPQVMFNFTGNTTSPSLLQPESATKVYKIKYGAVVQVVLQGTSILSIEEHTVHVHGYDFYVLARGRGNHDEKRDSVKYNLVDPPKRSTVGVPAGGWAVIRFRADNPGVWFVHCHVDLHLEWGMATAFLVENGVGEMESVPPPPTDLPPC